MLGIMTSDTYVRIGVHEDKQMYIPAVYAESQNIHFLSVPEWSSINIHVPHTVPAQYKVKYFEKITNN